MKDETNRTKLDNPGEQPEKLMMESALRSKANSLIAMLGELGEEIDLSGYGFLSGRGFSLTAHVLPVNRKAKTYEQRMIGPIREAYRQEDAERWIQNTKDPQILTKFIDLVEKEFAPQVIEILETRMNTIKAALLAGLSDKGPNYKEKKLILSKEIILPGDKDLTYARALKEICSTYEALAQETHITYFKEIQDLLESIPGKAVNLRGESGDYRSVRLSMSDYDLRISQEDLVYLEAWDASGDGERDIVKFVHRIVDFHNSEELMGVAFIISRWKSLKSQAEKIIADSKASSLGACFDALKFGRGKGK